jgi:hypothetical protein
MLPKKSEFRIEYRLNLLGNLPGGVSYIKMHLLIIRKFLVRMPVVKGGYIVVDSAYSCTNSAVLHYRAPLIQILQVIFYHCLPAAGTTTTTAHKTTTAALKH